MTDTYRGYSHELSNSNFVPGVKNTNGPEQVAPRYGIDNWMICWNAGSASGWHHDSELTPGIVEVGPCPDYTGWSDKYQSSAGCCDFSWKKLSQSEKLQHLVNGLFFLVLGPRLDPLLVHRELLKIKDYHDLKMGFFGSGAYTFFQNGRCDPYNE